MTNKSAAGMIALAAFLFAVPASAQIDETEGNYYADCTPAGGPAVTMELDNHLRITVYDGAVKADDVYRTKTEVMEGERETMAVGKCDAQMKNCQSVEGILSTYKTDDDSVEATLEYFDGTETQGDAESIQGRTTSFTAQRDKSRPAPVCR